MRGFAMLDVFIYHCYGEVFPFDQDHLPLLVKSLVFPLARGGNAVLIFFVISGFCIHLSHERSARKDWGTFCIRRFFRIYPPYLVALLIFSFVPPWRFVSNDLDLGGAQLVTHLFLVHNLWDRTMYGINASFWSIAVEVQIYALYPVLVWLAWRLGWRRALWVTAVPEMGIRTYMAVHDMISSKPSADWIPVFPFSYWFSWAIAAAAAEAYLKGHTPPFARVPLWVFPVLLVTTGMYPPLQAFGFPLVALSMVCVINWLIARVENRPLSSLPWWWRHLRFAGIVSYSAYLIHQPLVGTTVGLLERTRLSAHPVLILLLTFASWIPVLALSWCFYRLLELPGIEMGKRILKARESKSSETRAARGVSPI